jgi:hypothetical protein
VRLFATETAAVIPDSSKRLSEGVVVQTSLLARVLGIKLLTVEGTVLLSPARLQQPENYNAATAASCDLPADIQRDGAGESSPVLPVGSRLGLVARLLDENATQLGDLNPDDQG